MKHGKDDPAVPMEMDDEEYERQMQQLGRVDNEDYSSDEEEKEEQVVYHHRQTFVYSATLTLPPSMHHLIIMETFSINTSFFGWAITLFIFVLSRQYFTEKSVHFIEIRTRS